MLFSVSSFGLSIHESNQVSQASIVVLVYLDQEEIPHTFENVVVGIIMKALMLRAYVWTWPLHSYRKQARIYTVCIKKKATLDIHEYSLCFTVENWL